MDSFRIIVQKLSEAIIVFYRPRPKKAYFMRIATQYCHYTLKIIRRPMPESHIYFPYFSHIYFTNEPFSNKEIQFRGILWVNYACLEQEQEQEASSESHANNRCQRPRVTIILGQQTLPLLSSSVMCIVLGESELLAMKTLSSLKLFYQLMTFPEKTRLVEISSRRDGKICSTHKR